MKTKMLLGKKAFVILMNLKLSANLSFRDFLRLKTSRNFLYKRFANEACRFMTLSFLEPSVLLKFSILILYLQRLSTTFHLAGFWRYSSMCNPITSKHAQYMRSIITLLLRMRKIVLFNAQKAALRNYTPLMLLENSSDFWFLRYN